ncbi:hypothetical protein F7D08_1154 [Bifidobacterium cebidarum]|uniref:Uncharacterized protein n=1 Tax=Bifidobacterium cebidarum TaxID=2650773 RepID=A0A6I1GEZ8_9BIFI|nr:hypothetical protein F7D08_1154 [Bifidobacterium cebidarum]
MAALIHGYSPDNTKFMLFTKNPVNAATRKPLPNRRLHRIHHLGKYIHVLSALSASSVSANTAASYLA